MIPPLPQETIDRMQDEPFISKPRSPDALSHAIESAFSTQLEVGTLKLRPFSLGTLSLCRRLNLDMITGDRDAADLTDDEKQMQIVAFIFIQSQPMIEVLRAAKDPDFMVNFILPFSMNLPVDALPQAIAELQKVM